ncbi:hypothetical protein [Methanococcoides methylutens]|uniref:Uncharacterized protein n=1 Tax=Methanococcoides methylutens MM1 TaxID=1434104 RepID=A0A0E3WYW1_METMT|nr:hypothetical protein [Methanococcoides methylutens]AKB84514.1 hypothetical protein MCMEM_0461 [Methanococcoides methylutens MM1]
MNKKQDGLPENLLEGDRQSGAKDSLKKSSVTSIDESSEEGEPPEKTILISFVDNFMGLKKNSGVVNQSVAPEIQIEKFSSKYFLVSTRPYIQTSRTTHKVLEVVKPQHKLTKEDFQTQNFRASIIKNLRIDRIPILQIKNIQPEQQLEGNKDFKVTTVQDLNSDRITHKVTHFAESKSGSQNQKGYIYLEEKDPVFIWGGGSPHGSDRPKFIVHLDHGNVPSLQFLQVLLRDTYKEIEGGEPGAQSVEFVANEPRIPTVQKNIVTLDLTDGDWNPSIRNNKPVIERNGIDIVPKLREVASNLYTGQLGYFILNVPKKWEHPIRRKDFFAQLVERLSSSKITTGKGKTETFVDKVKSSPILLVDTYFSNENDFFRKVSKYFSLTASKKFSSIGQIEAVKEKILKKNDWKRIALTKRHENESYEHYFWKALIVEGLARKLWLENEEGFTDFEDFLKKKVIRDGIIKTEVAINGGIIPDIEIDTSEKLVIDGLNSFVEIENNGHLLNIPAFVEFETGISEGAYNFRKIRNTLEKYLDKGLPHETYIYIVVPSRLLFRGKKRANMIIQLVNSWKELNEGYNVEIFTPVIGSGTCSKLVPAKKFINSIYEDNKE